ncbi:hypothetical protein A3SI_15438 [Nitritalea halalkaliphila LW7]|uniref:Uncharacterized protein n=1 Tax=Nitritalea halalkaliphila LW7 TaxID=1189621 RepID=I5BYD7_9BACT|nr:hypothetical protein [Nitritalea halalkaliphila]EIM74589.1 hypothetical protein A3SI_15438 [Nitritalea halalkaliphila LW7]
MQELVFESTLGTRNEGWFANRKFRAVLLFYYFDGALLRNAYTFSTICRIFDEIYQIRNLNHRGGKINKVQQSIIERIRGNEAKYYFKFYGFLQDFVGTIEETLQKNLRLSQ